MLLSKNSREKENKETGFSLIEVLISLAIASFIIISLFDGFSTSLRISRTGYCQAKAAMIGEKYASQYKAGIHVPSTVKEGNWTLKIVKKNTSDGKTVNFFEIYSGGRKCIDFPIK